MERLLGSYSAVSVKAQHFLDKINTFWWYSRPYWPAHFVDTLLDIPKNLFVCFSIKRRLSTQQDVQDYTTGPYIALLCIFTGKDLWRNVIWRAVSLMHFRRRIKRLRSSKIDDFYHGALRFRIKEQVLRLQIAMHDLHGVAVRHRWQHLLQDHGGISLAVVWPLDDLIEQFTSTAMFRHNEVTLRILIDLEKSDDVRVIHCLEDFNFL